jgi:hypothetical protein
MTGIRIGNVPTDTPKDTSNFLFTEGEAPRKYAYGEVKKDILGTEPLYDPSLTPKEAINKINASLSESMQQLSFLEQLKLKFVYGVKGDGTVDDTTAIKNAINALTNGGTIFFPQGTYNITTLPITGLNNIKLVGNNATLNGISVSVSAILDIENSTHITIEGIRFTYFNKPSSYSSNLAQCIKCYNYAYIHIYKCEFNNFADIGISADQAQDSEGVNGGTTSTPLTVEQCLFINQVVSSDGGDHATSIYLGSNGEYTRIINNEFRKVCSAVKGYGANALVEGNTIMECTASYSATNALIYFNATGTGGTDGVNSSKCIIANNRINHNYGGACGIYCIGDASRNERRFTIVNNHVLVDGTGSTGFCIGISNAEGTLISGNYTIPISDSIPENILITNSPNVVVVDNTMQYVTGIKCVGSTIHQSNNIVISPSSSSIQNIVLDSTSKILSNNHLKFRFNTGGVVGGESSSKISVTKVATGHFTVTHNIGNILYIVNAQIDNNSTAPHFINVVRTTNSFDIYIFDISGNLVDDNVMGLITL